MRILPFLKPKKGYQVAGGGFDSRGSSYTLPVASADTLGGVKVGSGLSITDGVLSASGGGGLNYSTDEQNTGIKWTNNSLIYCKTIGGLDANTSATLYNVDLNASRIIDVVSHGVIGNYSDDFGWSPNIITHVRLYTSGSCDISYNNAGGTNNSCFTIYYTKKESEV